MSHVFPINIVVATAKERPPIKQKRRASEGLWQALARISQVLESLAWREAHELGLVEPIEGSHRGHREHGARIRRAGERFVLVLSKASAREPLAVRPRGLADRQRVELRWAVR